MTNWANKGKAAANAKPLTTTANKKDRGERNLGVVEHFKPRSYSTGSFGVEIAYTLEGIERKVYENIVLKKLGADGNFTATPFGEQSLKRRLQAFGLTSDEINAFPIPKTPKDESEMYNFAGVPVAVYITQETYMDKVQNRVASVWPKD
jgi:hypothetical protein